MGLIFFEIRIMPPNAQITLKQLLLDFKNYILLKAH